MRWTTPLPAVTTAIRLVLAGIIVTTPARAADWTFLVYMAADNNLESAGIDDLNEMEVVGSTANVNVVVQFDRNPYYDTSNGNWTTCRRYYVVQDSNPAVIGSTLVQDLGEVNMGSGATLRDFIQWGQTNYPATRYAVVLWNHGGGWRSIAPQTQKGCCWDDTDGGDYLTTKEFTQAVSNAGVPLAFLGFDVCFGGMMEIAYELWDSGLVSATAGSAATEPGDGWDYTALLNALVATPGMGGVSLANAVVSTYQAYYSGETMAALDLSQMSAAATAVSNFAATMISEGDEWPAAQTARANAQSYTYSYYRDLRGFIAGVGAQASNATVIAAANSASSALNSLVTAYYAGTGYPNGMGVAVEFHDNGAPAAYLPANLAWAEDTQWDEFLTAYAAAATNPNLTVSKNLVSVTVRISHIDRSVIVQNAGTGALAWSLVDEDASWLTVTPMSGTLDSSSDTDELIIEIDPSGYTPGTGDSETFTVWRNDDHTDKEDVTVSFVYEPADVMVVDDDANAGYEAYYVDALTAVGIPCSLWDVALRGAVTPAALAEYCGPGKAVVWLTGDDWISPLTSTEQTALAGFLDGGGRLFISGQDIGYAIGGTAFYGNYLHATYLSDDTDLYTIQGSADSPITSPWTGGTTLAITGGTGANNQGYPSEIAPVLPATQILTYQGSAAPGLGSPGRADPGKPSARAGARGIVGAGGAGISVSTGVYRLVYLSFGFEAIADTADRQLLMQKVLTWLGATGNQPPSAPTVVITPAKPNADDWLECSASGSTDPNGDPVTYKYQWYKDGVIRPARVWPRVDPSRTRVGETWRCVVTPTDGIADGPTGEATVVIANRAPTAPTVTIAPGDPTTCDQLCCGASGSTDPDGDSVTYRYQWYKNGQLCPARTWPNVAAFRTTRGDEWRCVVTPTDGTDDGPTGEATVTIGNAPPSAPVVAITPEHPTVDDRLECSASGSTDPDGDPVSYQYQWYKDGVLRPARIWPRIDSSRTSLGETWRCVVTPTDGMADGPSGEATVVIGAPGAGSGLVMITSLAAQPAGPGAEITFTLSGEARIAAEIINLAGRPVRLLTADRPMTAGTKRLVWDGRSATGVSVPAGVYLVRVGAAAQSGQQATAVTSMALLR